jgi:Flp pilus assembly protein TadD
LRRTDRLTRACLAIFLPALGLSLCSCASHSQTAHAVVPSVAIPISMEQQIRNAVNAGDGDIEIQALRERVIANPESISYRVDLGNAYEKRGYPELALDHYRLAADRAPDSPEPVLLIAKSLKKTGHVAEAAATLSKFTASHPHSSPGMYSWLGIFEDESQDFAAGERAHRQALTAAVNAGEDRDYLHNNLGYSLLQQKRNEEAAAEFRAALRLNPQSAIARDNLGSSLVANPKEAILNWQSLNEPAVAHSNLAAILIEQGSYAEARKELQIALEYNNANPAALANLKLLSELDGKPVTIPAQITNPKLSRMRSAWNRFVNGPRSAGEDDGQKASRASLPPNSATQNPELKP